MLERELREMTHVPRWGIVRTLRQQYLSDHTAMVAVYANDLAIYLGLNRETHLALLQMSLWHDFREEIFSGDITGPCKRAGMGTAARADWDRALLSMATRIFGRMGERDGTNLALQNNDLVLLTAVLKLADMLDECCEMGVELSLGNTNVRRIYVESLQRVENAVEDVAEAMGWPVPPDGDVPFDQQKQYTELLNLCRNACHTARYGESRNTVFDNL